MAVVIRMKRSGRSKRPCYRISVADSRSPRDGRTIETLGVYDPIASNAEQRVTLDVERAQHWISVGAQPSDTVRSILKSKDVELPVHKKRDRSGRKAKTKTKAARAERKKAMAERREAKRAAS